MTDLNLAVRLASDALVPQVKKVYSGTDGACMCGCKGSWKYASAHQAAGSASRGYPVTDADVSDRSVKLVVKKMLACDDAKQDGNLYYGTSNGRVYAVYLD